MIAVALESLPLGSAFRVAGCALSGRLRALHCGSAVIECAAESRSFCATGRDGQPVQVDIGNSFRSMTVARSTMVEPVEDHPRHSTASQTRPEGASYEAATGPRVRRGRRDRTLSAAGGDQ